MAKVHVNASHRLLQRSIIENSEEYLKQRPKPMQPWCIQVHSCFDADFRHVMRNGSEKMSWNFGLVCFWFNVLNFVAVFSHISYHCFCIYGSCAWLWAWPYHRLSLSLSLCTDSSSLRLSSTFYAFLLLLCSLTLYSVFYQLFKWFRFISVRHQFFLTFCIWALSVVDIFLFSIAVLIVCILLEISIQYGFFFLRTKHYKVS